MRKANYYFLCGKALQAFLIWLAISFCPVVVISFPGLSLQVTVGRGRILKEGSRVALLGYGTIVQSCLAARELLQPLGISVTVADARFCKPLNGRLIRKLAKEHEFLITIEEGSIGGFSSHVSHYMALNGLLDGNLKWRAMTLPDRYIEHGDQKYQTNEAGLTPNHIAERILSLVGENKEIVHLINV
ncbi:hypothetical protein R6Q59_023289 [Mikania micrantha]